MNKQTEPIPFEKSATGRWQAIKAFMSKLRAGADDLGRGLKGGAGDASWNPLKNISNTGWTQGSANLPETIGKLVGGTAKGMPAAAGAGFGLDTLLRSTGLYDPDAGVGSYMPWSSHAGNFRNAPKEASHMEKLAAASMIKEAGPKVQALQNAFNTAKNYVGGKGKAVKDWGVGRWGEMGNRGKGLTAGGGATALGLGSYGLGRSGGYDKGKNEGGRDVLGQAASRLGGQDFLQRLFDLFNGNQNALSALGEIAKDYPKK